MDELIIEEKRYISSKQAAKITGYAKDYVGQLCREGRVPARLVGRSWYVLDSAIQDHRFGDSSTENVEKEQPEPFSVSHTWESPRYEASPVETLPSVNRLSESVATEEEGSAQASEDAPESLHDSWRSWFDQVADNHFAVAEAPAIAESISIEPKNEPIEEKSFEMESEGEIVQVPIHVMSQHSPERVSVPRTESMRIPAPSARTSRDIGSRALGTIRVLGTVLALLSVGIAVLGSGYFDDYLISSGQASVITGMSVYNK